MTQHLRLSMEQYRAISAKGGRLKSKYGNKKKEVDGRTFDSGREAKRYQELLALQAGGFISELKCQRPVACVVNNFHVCDYIADFVYLNAKGVEIHEDVKSVATQKNPVYRIKKKLVLACTGIQILET